MIRILQEGAVATVWLERPETRNALPIAGWDALTQVPGAVADARAVILRSAVPGIFSAGADIGEFEQLQRDPGQRVRFREAMRAGIEAIATLPMPVLAAVDGGCFGAAVALVLAADICLAGDAAVFAVPPARFGIGYPHADVARLVAQIGRGHAAHMLFTAERIDADAAQAIGLARRVPDAAMGAQALAETIAGNAPDAVRLLKRMIAGVGGDLDTAFDDAFGGQAFAEGLAAFQAKREPRF